MFILFRPNVTNNSNLKSDSKQVLSTTVHQAQCVAWLSVLILTEAGFTGEKVEFREASPLILGLRTSKLVSILGNPRQLVPGSLTPEWSLSHCAIPCCPPLNRLLF